MAERILLLFLLLFSTFYFYAAQQLDFGTMLKPMAGFLPSIAGILSILLIIILLIQRRSKKQNFDFSLINWTKFIIICVGLVFFAVILHFLGYFLATFLFLFYLFKITGATDWVKPCIIALISTIFFYVLFIVYLAVPLP